MRVLNRRTAVLLLASALHSGILAAGALPARTSTQSGVTITVTPRQVAGDRLEFDVVMDTHSQQLTDDLATTAVLITATGELAPARWSGDPPGGHHRKGILAFEGGRSLQLPFRLRLDRAGEPQPRFFSWDRN